MSIPQEDAWLWEATLILVEHVAGRNLSLDEKVEAVLAEAWTAALGRCPGADALVHEHGERLALLRAWRQELARWQDQGERLCEGRIPRGAPAQALQPAEATPLREPLPETPEALDSVIHQLAAELQARDLALGRAAWRLFEADGWRRLGYGSAAQYARERAGVSVSSLKARLTLARRAEGLPEVGEALAAGQIGFEAAQLLARVSLPVTARPWVERARERTAKHLREEVLAVELLARVGGGALLREGPPDDEALSAVGDLERAVRSGAVLRPQETSQMSAPADPPGPEDEGGESQGVAQQERPEARVRPAAGRVSLRLVLREDLADFWRCLEGLHRRLGTRGSFVRGLCLAFWRTWGPCLEGPDVAYRHIYERDMCRCASPVCSRRDLTPHHLVRRSQGGDDQDENLVSLCSFCHLEGVHGGRLRAAPPASRITWTIGRQGLLRVEGRSLAAA